MISIIDDPWAAGWTEGHQPPKDQTVAEWCAENVYLPNSPIGAKYQMGGHSDDVLNDLQDPAVYESNTVGHTGMGKSAIIECACCYIVAQAPGPALILGQTDKTVQEWSESRGRKAMELCEPVARLMPSGKDRSKTKKMSIMFHHMEMFLGGANLTNTQEKSMRYTIGDEPWAWDHGIIGELLKRHHDRWNRKSLLLAQGGVDGDDWFTHTKNGLGFDRAFRCPECDHEQIFSWQQVKYEKIRDGNGEWDWPEIVKTVKYECAQCGEPFEDSARGRKRLTENSFYLCRNNPHVPGRVTRYVPAMANPRIQLFSLVQEWLLAQDDLKNGDSYKLRQFIQKRLAQFWVEKVDTPTLSTGGDVYRKTDYNAGEKWEGEHARFMKIDVQKGHFWVVIRAWRIGDGAESRLLWEGKADTWQTLFDLQERFGVENRSVFIDGRYEIDEVVRQITAHCGEPTYDQRARQWNFENQWVILIGQDNAKGYAYDVGTPKRPKKVWRIFSKYQYGTTSRGQRFRTIHFSNLRAKDALSGFMALGKGEFGVPVDLSKNYVAQMQSETKKEVKPGLWRWEKIKSHYHNHMWDCEVEGIVGASIRGILRIETSD